MFILIRAIWREIVCFTPNFALFTNMWFKHDLDSKIEHLYNAYAEAYFDLLYIFTLYIYLYMFCKRYSTNLWRTVILLLCHLITPNHLGVTIFFVDVFCSKIINKIKQVRFDPKYMNQRQTLSCCTVCFIEPEFTVEALTEVGTKQFTQCTRWFQSAQIRMIVQLP